jgi:hypothetical protein
MPGPRVPAPLGLLIDTNVVLDVILKRSPWDTDAVLVLDAISRGSALGFHGAKRLEHVALAGLHDGSPARG